MIATYMIGLLPDGDAVYTDNLKPLEAQKVDALKWASDHADLLSVHAVVGNEITDITAAYCRMWMNRADLSDIEDEDGFPSIIRETVPELVGEVVSGWAEDARAYRDLRSDYRASVL